MLFPGRMRALGLAAFLLILAPLFLAGAAFASIVGLRITPAYFSPNADGVQDQVEIVWTLSDSASDLAVTIQVSGAPGAPVLRHIDLGARAAGTDSTSWNGTDDAALPLPDNRYAAVLTETPVAGAAPPTAQAVVVIDDIAPSIPTIDGALDSAQVDVAHIVSGFSEGADSVRVFHDGLFDTTVAVQFAPPDTFYSVSRDLHLGANLFAVQAKDLAGNVSAMTTAVTIRYVNAPTLVSARAAPPAFSPNGDGVSDSTHVNVDIDAPSTRVVVDVRAGEPPNQGIDLSTPVAHLFDGPLGAGITPFAWDGRDSVGALMPDGLYEFRVFAATFDVNGTPFDTPTLNTPIRIDTHPPGAPVLDPPLPAVSFRALLLVAGTSAGAESVFVSRNGTRVDEGADVFRFEVPLTPEVNTFTLQAVDSAGNESPVVGPITVNYETPVGFHANERFRANDAFVFNLLQPASEVDLTIYTLRGRPVRALVSREVNTHYDMEWDGKDELGQFAGDGPYVARARITYVDGTRTEAKGAVVLVK